MAVASSNEFPKVIMEEVATDGSATSSPSADHRALFLGEDGTLHLKDSGGTVTNVGGSGIADQGAFTYLDATEGAAPSTPASGFARIYAKSDGRIYSKDDAGVEYGPFDAAGGGAGGPLLYIDDTTLGTGGDEFSDPDLAGWTLAGGLTTADTTAVTTEPYDATCVDIRFSAQSDRMYKAVPTPASGNYEIYLTFHGITNSTAAPVTAAGGMIGLYFSNDAGTGTGCSWYNDGAFYNWIISANAYSGTGTSVNSTQLGTWLGTSNAPIVYKLSKSGTTITAGVSVNGGLTFKTCSRTDSTTFTRMGIIRLFTSGGTDPTLRVGRFNVVEL